MGVGCSYICVEEKALWFRRIANPNGRKITRLTTHSLHQPITPTHALIADIVQNLSLAWGFEILEIYEDDGNCCPDINKPVNIASRADNFFKNSCEDHPLWFVANDDAYLMAKISLEQRRNQLLVGNERKCASLDDSCRCKVRTGTIHVKV